MLKPNIKTWGSQKSGLNDICESTHIRHSPTLSLIDILIRYACVLASTIPKMGLYVNVSYLQVIYGNIYILHGSKMVVQAVFNESIIDYVDLIKAPPYSLLIQGYYMWTVQRPPHTITYTGILCVDRIVANVDRMIVPTTIAKYRVVIIKAVRWTNHVVVPL